MLPERTAVPTRLRGVLRKLRAAAARYGESQAAVVLRLVALYRGRGFRPGEALGLGMVDPALPAQLLEACFTKPELVLLQDRLNPAALIGLTEDKSLFDAHCAAHGIPVPAHFATLGRASGQIPTAVTLTSGPEWLHEVVPRLPASFITKPALGVYGEGVTAWTRVAGGFRDQDQRVHTAQALYDRCCADSRYDRFVVQERLTNHPSLVALTGAAALQTLRLVTLASPEGEVRVLYALWKLVIGDNVTDNFHFGRTGNLFANVGLADGELGAALGPSPDGIGLRPVVLHPLTGVRLEGFRLPDWNAVLELARRCARGFLPLRTIGWDIGLTPAGPVIVEGNRWWDPANGALLCPAVRAGAPNDMIPGAALLRAAARAAAAP